MPDYSSLLGRRNDTPRDPRDYPVKEALRALAAPKSQSPVKRTWRHGPILDQSLTPPSFDGDHPYCTGFAATARMMGAPVMMKLSDPVKFALQAYAGAQANDEFPGPPPSYDGSSGRGVCQWLRQQGMVSEFHLCATADEVADAILRLGTVLLGTPWSESMFTPDSKGLVAFDPSSIAGGHEYLAIGYDSSHKLVRCQNSWGAAWGRAGTFYMTLDTLSHLIENQSGDAFVVTEVPVHNKVA